MPPGLIRRGGVGFLGLAAVVVVSWQSRLRPHLEHPDPVALLAAAALLDRYGGLATHDGTEVKLLLTSNRAAVREFAIRALHRDGKPDLPWERGLLFQALDDSGFVAPPTWCWAAGWKGRSTATRPG